VFKSTPAPAGLAEAVYYHMLEINLEAVLFVKRSLHREKKVFIAVGAFTASPAYQVMMMPLFGVVIDESITEFAFKNATQFLKKLQCPVYRRFVNAGHSGLDMVKDFLSRKVVSSVVDSIQYQPPLRS
jgi:hypothetical protein